MSGKKKSRKKSEKRSFGLMRILEVVVIIGSLAAILMKFFKDKKDKK